MIHLFHGEHQENSRIELQKIRDNFAGSEIINLNGKKNSITDLYQALQSDSLLSIKKLVIVENYFSNLSKKKSTVTKEFMALLNQIPNEIEVVFWEEKKIGKLTLNELPKKIDMAVFEYDRKIFNLMDSIIPKNTTDLLYKFNAVIENDAVELVFAMLVRQFRLLLMVKEMGNSIPDLSSWQISKLNKQANFFTYEQLLQLYGDLKRIDQQIKTSVSAFDLTDSLKLFLIKV